LPQANSQTDLNVGVHGLLHWRKRRFTAHDSDFGFNGNFNSF